MSTTESIPSSLVSALAKVQAKLPIIVKGETAKVPMKSGGSYSYSYADLADVAKIVYPLLGEVGLVFIARPKFIEGRYVLLGVLEHESGESRDSEFPLPDRGAPQELGSAISYGRRYLLGCLTGVVTGDQDDDGAAATAFQRQAQAPPPAERDPADANVVAQFEELIDAAATGEELNGLAADIAGSSLTGTDRDGLRKRFAERMKQVAP